MNSKILKLNRFTTIPFLIDMLKRETLTLLYSDFWVDFNGRKTLKAYKNSSRTESIYALCLTYANEMVYHWNAFANGTSGCCIEFSSDKLFPILGNKEGVIHDKIEYLGVNRHGSFAKKACPI